MLPFQLSNFLKKSFNVVQNAMFLSRSSIRNLISTSLSSSELRVEVLEGKDAGIVVLGLNRPSARNALGNTLTSSLMNAVKQVHLDKHVRVTILRSLIPNVFCAGADLKERIQLSNSDVSVMVSRLSSLSTAIENIPVPTIAAIDGVALGGGLEISLGCDFRIVSQNAKLGLVETKLAIMPAAGGTQRLPRIINPAIAKELIYCARVIDGNEAKTIGLANHCVEQNSNSDAAYQRALLTARQILANGPLGVKMAKIAVSKGLETDIQTGCKIEQLCYAQLIPTEDRTEGLLAFKENRTPRYKGE